MREVCSLVWSVLVLLFRSRVSLETEILILRHQLNIQHLPKRRWKSRHRCGRPTVPLEIRRLIRQMSIANPLWGAPRSHGELLKLGIEIFLRNHAAGIVAMDPFVVPTISFRLLYGLLIMGDGRRQICGLG